MTPPTTTNWTKRIIIGGLPRSGSTLLRWLLDASNQVLAGPETGFFTTPFDRQTKANPRQLQKLSTTLNLPQEHIKSILNASTDQCAAFDQIMSDYATNAGVHKNIWAEKTPNNCLRYQELAEQYPDLYFISTVRDGRDVVTSKMPNRPSYYVNNARFIECTSAIVNFNHPNHTIVQYEHLVSNPQQVIETLCAFLDIEYDDSLLTRYQEHTATRDPSKIDQPKLDQPISGQWVRRWTMPEHASRVRDFVNCPGVLELLTKTGYEHTPDDRATIAFKHHQTPDQDAQRTTTMGILSSNLEKKLEKKEIKRIQKILDRELPAHRPDSILTRQRALDACAYPPEAIEIIDGSSYNPNHAHVGFHRHLRASNVINDFFDAEQFTGKRIVEFGPGHYSFAMLARELGATVICVERHEEHARLGRVLGFEVIEKDFADLTPEDFGGQIDGLWMKGAFNACRMPNDQAIDDLVQLMTALLTPDAWAWCVTVNMFGKEDQPDNPKVLRCVELQRAAFQKHGWNIEPIDESDRKRYAMSYKACNYYFTRALAPAPIGA